MTCAVGRGAVVGETAVRPSLIPVARRLKLADASGGVLTVVERCTTWKAERNVTAQIWLMHQGARPRPGTQHWSRPRQREVVVTSHRAKLNPRAQRLRTDVEVSKVRRYLEPKVVCRPTFSCIKYEKKRCHCIATYYGMLFWRNLF